MGLLKRILRFCRAYVRSLNPLHQVAVLLVVVAVVMLPWMVYLGATLHGRASVRMWSTTWVGLDTLEVLGLIMTAVSLLWRRSFVVIAATFTATLFLLDAWFDVMLAQAGGQWYEALFSAIVGEIPMAIVCFGVALTAPAWIRDADSAAARAARRLEWLQAMRERLEERRLSRQ